jgi:hypothetical protein
MELSSEACCHYTPQRRCYLDARGARSVREKAAASIRTWRPSHAAPMRVRPPEIPRRRSTARTAAATALGIRSVFGRRGSAAHRAAALPGAHPGPGEDPHPWTHGGPHPVGRVPSMAGPQGHVWHGPKLVCGAEWGALSLLCLAWPPVVPGQRHPQRWLGRRNGVNRFSGFASPQFRLTG